MKIAVFNGSPRKENTFALVEAFREGAEAAGHEVTVYHVGQMKITGCLGCQYCHTKGDFILEGSAINDEIVGEQTIMQKQDERAVESMVKCGLPLEAVFESFPQFAQDDIKEIFDRIKGEDTFHEVPEKKRNCSQ